MNSFLRFLPIVALFFFAATFSPHVLAIATAQNLNNSSYSNPQPYTQDGTNNFTAPIGTANSTGSGFNIDWRWALPLLLVGVGLLFLRGSGERMTRRFYTPSMGYDVAYHDVEGEKKRKRKQIKRLKKPLKAA